MREPRTRSIRDTLSLTVWCAALVALLSSCSTGIPVQHEVHQTEEPTRYSIVYVIHGDGDYLYHDTGGNEYNADEKALAGAKLVALQNPKAEVFIFHQKPRHHFLFLFPLRDGDFYYYRNGRFVANETYWRDQPEASLGAEVELYRRYRVQNQRETRSIFLYYGHEVPEFDGVDYDASYPNRAFTVHDFARGLKDLRGDSTKFDLIILSTCFGGTPYTIGTLGTFARYIIASPDNLHLSYFELHSLERLDLRLRDGDVHAFAKTIAQQTFDRLTSEIQTAVSIAVYDVDRVQNFVRSVRSAYDQTLTDFKGEASMVTAEHCDCAELPAYMLPAMSMGVEIFYRAARFGRSKNKVNHSGWECWRLKEPRPANLQTTELEPK